MKRIVVLIIAGVSVYLLATIASAQCSMPGMSGGHDHDSSSKAESDGAAKTSGMMKDMTKQCQEMTEDFARLHEHFTEMMQIADMNKLQDEMQKHNDMMIALHKKMSDQLQQCQEMISTMDGGSKTSSDEGQAQHNH